MPFRLSDAMLPPPMPLTALERRVIAGLPGIDPDRVGEVLGVGAQSVVRAYDIGGHPQVCAATTGCSSRSSGGTCGPSGTPSRRPRGEPVRGP